MKHLSKKNIKVLIAFCFLLFTAIGLTLAYYSSQKDFQNEFHVKEPGVAIYEKFNPTDWWVPDEEKSKQAWFTNTGEMDMLLRFKIDVEWAEGKEPKDKDGNVLPVAAKDVVTLYWKDSSGGNAITLPEEKTTGFDFMPITENGTTYYYYTKILKAKDLDGSSTQHVLESVKFSPNLSNDGHLHSNYADTQIDLTISGQTVLVDERAVEEQWPGVTVSFTKNSTGAVTVNWERTATQ